MAYAKASLYYSECESTPFIEPICDHNGCGYIGGTSNTNGSEDTIENKQLPEGSYPLREKMLRPTRSVLPKRMDLAPKRSINLPAIGWDMP